MNQDQSDQAFSAPSSSTTTRDPDVSESQAATQSEAECSEQPEDAAETKTDAEQLTLLSNQTLRLSADIENMRRRHQQEISKAHSYGLEKCFRELIPVLDSLSLALTESSKEEQNGQLYKGVELTNQLLVSSLEKFGLQAIRPAVKDSFNPELHEAMTTAPTDDMPPNSVVQVIQCGYQLSDRLLRPARVIVSAAPAVA